MSKKKELPTNEELDALFIDHQLAREPQAGEKKQFACLADELLYYGKEGQAQAIADAASLK